MADELKTPDIGAAQVDPGERFTGQLQARTRRAQPTADAALPRPQDEAGYKSIPFGSKYISPEGETLTKYYRPKSTKEYAGIPEGSQYMSPEGEVLTKQVSEPLSFSAQTLYNMGVNDKERRKALEKFYPGKVRDNPHTGELEIIEEDGKIRRPKGFQQSPFATVASEAAPVLGAGLGALVGGPTLVGNVAAGAGGAALGQGFNDLILGLTGVMDRSLGEEATVQGLAAGSAAAGGIAGRAVSSMVPSIKHGLEYGAPAGLAKFLGAEKEGTQMALQLREKGVLTPISPWAPEAPMAINIAEVYDPAFRTQQPLEQSAVAHYERTAKSILEESGAKAPESVSKPTAAVSVRETGEALQKQALSQLQVADARLDAELARRQSLVRGQNQVAADPKSLQQTAIQARKAADAVVQQGFVDIQKDVDAAMASTKAGHNSGDLWWAVGEKFRAVREGIMGRANTMYTKADQAAGGQLPNVAGLPDLAKNFLAQLPEGFENRFPGVVKQIRDIGGVTNAEGGVVKEAVNPTFGQLHNLRSFMRSNFNYFNLTPDVKEGTFKYFAKAVDNILENPGATPELKEAATLLREADTFYRENMGPLNDRRIQSVMDGLRSGMPADPKVLFDAIVKEGRTEVTNKAREMIGPNLWAGVKAADVQEMLEMSKTLTPDVLDGKKFVSQVLDRHRRNMLEAVHGREASEKLLRQAQAIEALEGRLDIPTRPGDTLTELVNRARLASEAAEAAAKTDPMVALTKEMNAIEGDIAKQRRGMHALAESEPLGFLYDPTMEASKAAEKILASDDLVLASAMQFGKDSPEFKMLQQNALQQILHGTIDPGKRLASWTEETQQILFPGTTLKNLQTLAKEMDYLMGSKAARVGSGQSIAAQSRVTHPWTSLPFARTATKITGMDFVGRKVLGEYYKFVLETFNRPGLMRFVLKGLEGDEAAKAISREEMRKIIHRGGVVGAGVGESQEQVPRQPPLPRAVRQQPSRPTQRLATP